MWSCHAQVRRKDNKKPPSGNAVRGLERSCAKGAIVMGRCWPGMLDRVGARVSSIVGLPQATKSPLASLLGLRVPCSKQDCDSRGKPRPVQGRDG